MGAGLGRPRIASRPAGAVEEYGGRQRDCTAVVLLPGALIDQQQLLALSWSQHTLARSRGDLQLQFATCAPPASVPRAERSSLALQNALVQSVCSELKKVSRLHRARWSAY